MRRWPSVVIAALALLAVSGVAAYQIARPQAETSREANWQEIAWPFLRDAWPAGRAFRCRGCGEAVELYVRPKIGFCNCDDGITDDDEVDRVSDLDLISDSFAPLAPGHVVHVADMEGRARAYDLHVSDGPRHVAIGIALHHRCDVVVVVVRGGQSAVRLQRAAIAFLETSQMKHWLMVALREQ